MSTDKSNSSKPGSSGERTGRMNFGMVDKHVMRDPRLPLTVKALYSYLSTYCGATRSAFPSRQTMAKELGCAVRTVDAALKVGVEAGLWTVTGRAGDDGRQTSNLYLIHDFEGGYEARGAESARGDSAEICTVPVSESAPEQDHLSKPSSGHTTSTSSDAVAAIASKTSFRGTRKIYLPNDFAEHTDGEAMQYLVGAAIRSIKKAGLIPHWQANDKIGVALKEGLGEGKSRSQLVEDVRRWVKHADTEHPTLGQLAYLPESRAA